MKSGNLEITLNSSLANVPIPHTLPPPESTLKPLFPWRFQGAQNGNTDQKRVKYNNTTFRCQTIPTGNYMFKIYSRNTRTRCETCSKLTIKTPERLLLLFI